MQELSAIKMHLFHCRGGEKWGKVSMGAGFMGMSYFEEFSETGLMVMNPLLSEQYIHSR